MAPVSDDGAHFVPLACNTFCVGTSRESAQDGEKSREESKESSSRALTARVGIPPFSTFHAVRVWDLTDVDCTD